MKLAYVAGPHRGKSKIKIINWLQRQINIHRARRVAKELWRMGYAVLCPHSNTSNFDGLCPDKTFLDGTLEMMRRCDLMVLIPRWQKSEGTWGEVDECLRLGIPIYTLFKNTLVRVDGRKSQWLN